MPEVARKLNWLCGSLWNAHCSALQTESIDLRSSIHMRATPWSTAFLLLLCGSALMLGGCNWTVPWFGPPAAVEQPIAFNHRKHAAGADGIKCDTCHSYSS